MEGIVEIRHITVILHIQEHTQIGGLFLIHIDAFSHDPVRALVIFHGIHDALFHINVELLVNLWNNGIFKGGILLFPGLPKLFLSSIAAPQEFSISLPKSRGEIAVFSFGPVADAVHRIPLGSAACRQKVTDHTVLKPERIHLVAELLQCFPGVVLPFF